MMSMSAHHHKLYDDVDNASNNDDKVERVPRINEIVLHRKKTENKAIRGSTLPSTVQPTATVLVSQAEAIVRSLTNMAAADSNGYLKSKYMLNINNGPTKHYTYSYIHVRTFTKT